MVKYKEQYKEHEKNIAEAMETLFNGGVSYKDNAQYFVDYAHRYIQNEAFVFFIELMRKMAEGRFDGRNRYAHSMAKKIIEYLDENEFVYEDSNNPQSDALIPYKDYKF